MKKRVFVDTNIMLDLLARRKPYYKAAARLFTLADQGKLELCVAALSFTSMYYVLSRLLSPGEARTILAKFKVLVTVLPLTDKVLELTLTDQGFRDFEDGIQYYTAIEHAVPVLLTRNLKDFKQAKIPVMTAGQYLKIKRR